MNEEWMGSSTGSLGWEAHVPMTIPLSSTISTGPIVRAGRGSLGNGSRPAPAMPGAALAIHAFPRITGAGGLLVAIEAYQLGFR
jgi:hypothetical protein